MLENSSQNPRLNCIPDNSSTPLPRVVHVFPHFKKNVGRNSYKQVSSLALITYSNSVILLLIYDGKIMFQESLTKESHPRTKKTIPIQSHVWDISPTFGWFY